MHRIDSALLRDVAHSKVCASVSVCVRVCVGAPATVSPAKTDEPIVNAFGGRTGVDPVNRVLDRDTLAQPGEYD